MLPTKGNLGIQAEVRTELYYSGYNIMHNAVLSSDMPLKSKQLYVARHGVSLQGGQVHGTLAEG